MTRKQIGSVLGAVVLAVAAPFLTLAVLHVLDGTAQALETVNFDVDPNVTGNSANTLGPVEDCVRVDIPSPAFDGESDYVIDIVVTGDTQAPTDYTASLTYASNKIHIADPGTDTDIKLQGAVDSSETRPDSDGTYQANVMYFFGGPGTAGNGTITRLGLDIGGSGVVYFGLIEPSTTYSSGAGSHQITVDDAWLAINMPCPGEPGAANKTVQDIIFDDASAYPNQGPALVPNNEFGVVAGLPAYLSVTSMDQNLGPDVPADAEISFYANIPLGCLGRWLPDTVTFPADVHTRGGDPNVPSSGQVVPPVAPMVPGGPGPLFEADLHFQTLEYGITEHMGPPIPLTRFFELVCPASDDYIFTFCNRADVKPPDMDPDPQNNLLCEELTVRSIPPQYAVDKQVLDVVFDDASNYPAPGPELAPPNLLTIPVGVDAEISVTSRETNLGPQPVIPPADAEISFYANIPAGCEAQFRYDQGANPLDILTLDGNPNVPSSGGPTGPGWVAGPRVVDLHFQTLEYGMTEPVVLEDPSSQTPGPCNDRIDNGGDTLTDGADPDCQASVPITRFFDLRCSQPGTKLFMLCNRADAKPPLEELSPGNNLRCEPLTVQVQGMPADLEKLELYVKPFYCGDTDMDGDEATGGRRLPGTGTCCDGVDNNHNGLTDGQDPNCLARINEDWPDGLDNDQDGLVDEDPPVYPSGQSCPWNGDDDCDGANPQAPCHNTPGNCVDEDPKNGIDDDGDMPPQYTPGTPCPPQGDPKCDEDPANGFLGIDTDADGWVDEDGAGRFDWNGDPVIEAVQLEGWDDDGDTRVDEDPLDSPAALPGTPPGYTAHEPHYMVKEILQNNGPNPSVLATDVRQFNAPAWRVDAREDGRTTCNDDLDNDPWNSDGIDAADPDCLATHVWEEAVGLHSCNDGLDNGADGPIDEADSDCQTQTEVSVECWPLDEVVTFGPGVVTRYIKPPSNDPILQAFPWCMQYYDPVHFNKCVPCKIPIPGPPLPPAPCSMLISQIGSPPGPGYCIAADSVQGPPGWPSELGLSEQVTLPVGVPVAREHQSDLACSQQTSLHEFTIRNELQLPVGIPDPDTENNSKEMEMLVACVSITDAEARNLVMPPDDDPVKPGNQWDVDVSTSEIKPVSVDVYNNGPVFAHLGAYFVENSPGLGIIGVDPGGQLADTDGDGWADAVEATLVSNPGDPASELPGEKGATLCTNGLDDDGDGYIDAPYAPGGCGGSGCDAGCSTPENLHAWVSPPSCSDGVDNDADISPGMDLADPKCADSDGDGYSDAAEMMLNSNPADNTSTPEHSQLPWNCGDGLDNDGDTYIDDAQPDYDLNGWGDCSNDQLRRVRPPVACASGWQRLDSNADTREDGTDAGGTYLRGDGSLRVMLTTGFVLPPGGPYTQTRGLVFHCFAPGVPPEDPAPYPTETVEVDVLSAPPHVLDANRENNSLFDEFSGIASCGAYADLEIASWDFVPEVPPDFRVGETHVYETTKTIHNIGPNAGRVQVSKSMDVPVNCDGSLRVRDAGEKVTIAHDTWYKMPPDVPDWTYSDGGAILYPDVDQTVYAQGSADITGAENELAAELTRTAGQVPVSMDVVVEEDFGIHCDVPGTYTFEFGNGVTLPDYPDICDPNLGNHSQDVSKTVVVQPPAADVKVLDFRADPPYVSPPPGGWSDPIPVWEVKHNNGPDATVADVDWWVTGGFPDQPVNVRWVAQPGDICTYDGNPVDCSFGGINGNIDDLHFQVDLPVSSPVLLNRDIQFDCMEKGVFVLTLWNQEYPVEPYVDPDPSNNMRSTDVTVYCNLPPLEADKQVLALLWNITAIDRNTTDPDLDIWTDTDVGLMVGSSDQNLGPLPTDSTITFLANVPAGCEGRWLAFTGDTLHEYERYNPTDPLTQIHGAAHRDPMVPGDGDPLYPPMRSAESALHFQAWEEPMAPTQYVRLFALHCSEDGVRTLTLCNKAEVMAPNMDPNLADNWQCRDLTVTSVDSAPGVDSDGDTVNDDIETYLGTDPADNCPDVVGGDDAWSLDINMSKTVTVVGDVLKYAGRIGTTGGPPPSPNWLQRLDLNVSNTITVVGDVLKFAGKIGSQCT